MAVWQHLVKRLVELCRLHLLLLVRGEQGLFIVLRSVKVGLLLFALRLSWPLIMSGGVHFFYFQVSDENILCNCDRVSKQWALTCLEMSLVGRPVFGAANSQVAYFF